jgi:hypothetical protein
MSVENKIGMGEPLPCPDSSISPEEIRRQLKFILASDPFKHSKRYQKFLQYVVERTLEGHGAELKERNVGVDVFEREANYDTAADPVVRITAGEVRKRIAQYYDRGPVPPLRITLPSGSYVPEFRLPEVPVENHSSARTPPAAAVEPPLAPKARSKFSLKSSYWLTAVVVAFVAGQFLPKINVGSTAIERFWQPVCTPGGAVLVSVGEPNANGSHDSKARASIPSTSSESNDLPTLHDVLVNNTVSWADAIAAARIASIVRAKGCTFQMKRSESTFLPDLKSSPAVLVGGFNNKWIMRLLAQQRFSYVTDPITFVNRIKDSHDSKQVQWQVNIEQPPGQFHQDFGIVARFWDPTAERWIVVVSGIAAYGTLAASEFLSNPTYVRMIQERAPEHWENRNMEVVFSTAIIDGNTGPPHILATWFW